MELIKKAGMYWRLGNPFEKRIGYIGWIGHQNLGDEMLYEAYKRLFPDYNILPFVSLSVKNRELLRRLTGHGAFRAGCLGGGTLINRDKGYLRIFSRLIDECSIRFCLGTGVANPEFWAASRGDWEEDLLAWIELLRQCQFVGVRGPIAASILREAGLPDAEVVGDSALILARESYREPVEEKLLGVNIGTSHGNVWGSEEGMQDRVAQVCKALRSNGWNTLFLCVWPDDMDSTAALAKRIGIHEPEIHLITSDVEQALDICERCTAFIGMKLHSVVSALCAGVPSIMIEYRPKCRDFMTSLGLEMYSFRSDSLDVDHMVGLLESFASNRTGNQKEIHQRIIELKRRLTGAAHRINHIIRNSSGS